MSAGNRSEVLAALVRGDLAGATRLDLSGLALETLPEELLGLADTLEFLDIGRNALSELPHWFSGLHRLRILFGSGNRFAALPPVLGGCDSLSQIGFRANAMTTLPAESLPVGLRWLTLTDNALKDLPSALGTRPGLRKALFAGNRLRSLPESLAGLDKLELLRISANAFEEFPRWLTDMQGLAWLAWGGNPGEAIAPAPARPIAWAELDIREKLGEGSSGEVYAARRRGDGAVALKLFKGSVGSDGLTEREIAASLTAGVHDGLIGTLGTLTGHPEARAGLVMDLVPPTWRVLAGPPSFASCTRDEYGTASFTRSQLRNIAADVGEGLAHLHRAGFAHGDFYAHNILWDGAEGRARLGDLGAASSLPGADRDRWTRADRRAWAILLAELLDHADNDWPAARALVEAFGSAAPPDLQEAVTALRRLS